MEGGSVGRAPTAMVKQGGRCRWQVTHMFFIQCLKSRNEVMVGSSSPPVRRRAPHCIEGSGDSRAPRAPLQMFVAGHFISARARLISLWDGSGHPSTLTCKNDLKNVGRAKHNRAMGLLPVPPFDDRRWALFVACRRGVADSMVPRSKPSRRQEAAEQLL